MLDARPARIDANGDPVVQEEQDRSAWDQALLAKGAAILEQALRRRRAGLFQIQAAIAARMPPGQSGPRQTGYKMVGLYMQLALVAPSVSVDLNRALPISTKHGLHAALAVDDAIVESRQPDDHYLLHATHAHLLRCAGRPSEAAESYRAGFDLRRAISEWGSPTGYDSLN